MPYTVGVSSGFWRIERPVDLLGIPAKAQWVGTAGVKFSQIDIESIAEFEEPDLKIKMDRVFKLGIEVGVHGECASIGMKTLPLESAIQTEYVRSHDRLIRHIKLCGENLKAKYLSIHASEEHPFILLGREPQPSVLVDVWGRPMRKFLEENTKILDWIVEVRDEKGNKVNEWLADRYEKGEKFKSNSFVWEFMNVTDVAELIVRYERHYQNQFYYEHKQELPNAEEKKELHTKAIKGVKNEFLEHINSPHHVYGPEKTAYFIIAHWMRDSKDPIWQDIVNENIKDEDLQKLKMIEKWVPAVAAKYVWGHFRQDVCPSKSDFDEERPLPLLKKYNMFFCFEAGMAEPGYEAYMRLVRLPHIYAMIKATGSEMMGITVDMEHMLGCSINVKKDIEAMPYKAGEAVKVIHVTVPSPLNPSHMPVPLASEAQLWIYERLWELRQKGFNNGWLIFERGGEKGTVQQTVEVMRLIARFLDSETPPNQLPDEFFGLKLAGPEIARQRVSIKEHALDPLKGTLMIPEEDYTFFGEAALRNRKIELWKKEEYR